MAAVRSGIDPHALNPRVQWADAATRSVAQEADAVVKLYGAGLLPASYVLKRLGYDADEIAQIRTARRGETLDAAGVQFDGLLPGPTEIFPREYVVKLRDESAKHRQRAADRDTLTERLHVALVTATGRLADPSDLAFNDAHLDDSKALTAAIDDLLARRPHLASRRVVGDVGQGATQGDTAVDLAGMLRRNARQRPFLRPRRHATYAVRGIQVGRRRTAPLRGSRATTCNGGRHD